MSRSSSTSHNSDGGTLLIAAVFAMFVVAVAMAKQTQPPAPPVPAAQVSVAPKVTIQRVDGTQRGPLERVVGFVLEDGTIRTVDQVFGPIDYVDVASIGVEFGCSSIVFGAGD